MLKVLAGPRPLMMRYVGGGRCFSTADNASSSTEDHNNAVLNRIRKELVEDKKQLKWRTPITEKPNEWNSNLKVFSDEHQNSDYIVMMQQPMSLAPGSIKEWWQRRKANTERHLQQFVPERHSVLGVDLAAAHFILYRGGAVRFVGQRSYMRATGGDKEDNIRLPTKYDPQYKVDAIRCDNMNLYYEGLENIRCLDHLKFLSFRNVKQFDDWSLDRVSGSEFPRLEVLDISATRCTHNGLACLYRLPSLKLLIVDDVQSSLPFELSCSMLQEAIPQLKVINAEAVHDL